ncbi:MAG: hypothetical protein IPL52_01745 [Flavobacteriales bacterium]|nr:hypothetical protein [Flavobacteriales bacterium]
MWPVQTLTLLLCLTDEEQLFAERIVLPEPPTPVTAPAPVAEGIPEDTLVLVA